MVPGLAQQLHCLHGLGGGVTIQLPSSGKRKEQKHTAVPPPPTHQPTYHDPPRHIPRPALQPQPQQGGGNILMFQRRQPRALVLDCAYKPINVITWYKAFHFDYYEKVRLLAAARAYLGR